MKKILVLFLFLVSCQSSDYDSGTSLYIDGSASECVYDARTQTAHENDCENLGWSWIKTDGSDGIKVELQPVSSTSIENVYPVFKEDGIDLNIPKLEFNASSDVTDGWFELRTYFLDKENIYIWNRSGVATSSNELFFYNGSEWKDWMNIEEAVKINLPQEYAELDVAIRDMLISADKINVSATLGDDIQYLELVNYILEFDRNTMELLNINEITKPL